MSSDWDTTLNPIERGRLEGPKYWVVASKLPSNQATHILVTWDTHANCSIFGFSRLARPIYSDIFVKNFHFRAEWHSRRPLFLFYSKLNHTNKQTLILNKIEIAFKATRPSLYAFTELLHCRANTNSIFIILTSKIVHHSANVISGITKDCLSEANKTNWYQFLLIQTLTQKPSTLISCGFPNIGHRFSNIQNIHGKIHKKKEKRNPNINKRRKEMNTHTHNKEEKDENEQ